MAASAIKVASVEIDPQRAAAARRSLEGLGNVELLVGDWRELLPTRGPFDLFFLDSGGFKEAPEDVGPSALALLEPGGLLVADDMVPGLRAHDAARNFLRSRTDVIFTEVLTTPTTSALIAAKTDAGVQND